MSLVKSIYLHTKGFPNEEKFGLTNQMRRCAISIPSNIAEGASRSSEKDFSRFLEIAIGSSFELETQLILSNELSFIDIDIFEELKNSINSIQRQINGLKMSIKKVNG